MTNGLAERTYSVTERNITKAFEDLLVSRMVQHLDFLADEARSTLRNIKSASGSSARYRRSLADSLNDIEAALFGMSLTELDLQRGDRSHRPQKERSLA